MAIGSRFRRRAAATDHPASRRRLAAHPRDNRSGQERHISANDLRRPGERAGRRQTGLAARAGVVCDRISSEKHRGAVIGCPAGSPIGFRERPESIGAILQSRRRICGDEQQPRRDDQQRPCSGDVRHPRSRSVVVYARTGGGCSVGHVARRWERPLRRLLACLESGADGLCPGDGWQSTGVAGRRLLEVAARTGHADRDSRRVVEQHYPGFASALSAGRPQRRSLRIDCPVD